MQQASNAAGIDLKGYAPQDEVPLSFYAKIPMRLDLTGKFHQIAKFAYELGKVDRIINVEDIERSPIVGDGVILKGRCLAARRLRDRPEEAPRAITSRRRRPTGGDEIEPPSAQVVVRRPVVGARRVQWLRHRRRPRRQPPPNRAAAAASAAALGPELKGPEYTENDFVESDRNRDPFRLSRRNQPVNKQALNQRKIELAQYSLDELKLVAIVTGGDQSRDVRRSEW